MGHNRRGGEKYVTNGAEETPNAMMKNSRSLANRGLPINNIIVSNSAFRMTLFILISLPPFQGHAACHR